MNHDEICYYYNIGSVLINVGASGGLPNVIVEAISSNLPVVATDAGATKDFVNEKNGTGVLIKSNEKTQIKKGVLQILETTNFGNNFDDEILKQFSFENFGKKLLNVYNDAYEEFQKNRNELM